MTDTFHKSIGSAALVLLLQYPPAWADQVVTDDQIVTGGSLCVGADCADGEEFAFDTVRLKSDDPLIRFQDTSASSAFPTNDWTMGITDNAMSGAAQFFITDVDGGAKLLLLESGENGGVALGADAVIEANAVSVGAVGAERRIVNVADGVDDTDAVNMGQFNAFTTSIDQQVQNLDINAETDAIDADLIDIRTRIDAINARIDELLDRVDNL